MEQVPWEHPEQDREAWEPVQAAWAHLEPVQGALEHREWVLAAWDHLGQVQVQAAWEHLEPVQVVWPHPGLAQGAWEHPEWVRAAWDHLGLVQVWVHLGRGQGVWAHPERGRAAWAHQGLVHPGGWVQQVEERDGRRAVFVTLIAGLKRRLRMLERNKRRLMPDRQTTPEETPGTTFHRFSPMIDHSLFRLFAAFNAYFALVQFRGAMLTTEIPAAAVARHEGHPDSILGFACITLTGAAGFGHCYVSRTCLIGF